MNIAVGCDHRGFPFKVYVVAHLTKIGHVVIDKGCFDTNPVDYPDYAEAVCDAIPSEASRGVLICGSGVGMCIAANKKPGIRAGLVTTRQAARLCREHNQCNVLCMPVDTIYVQDILAEFLSNPELGDRHRIRLDKIAALERKWSA